MSIEAARAYLKSFGLEERIREPEHSSATVELAAQALGVEGARIAKTLSFCDGDSALLVLTAGDAKIDNHRFKEEFGFKARMLAPDEVLRFTGHSIGGVCPFGLPQPLRIFLDVSLQRFTTVFPAAGSGNSAIELSCDELFACSKAIKWVDVCKAWREEELSK